MAARLSRQPRLRGMLEARWAAAEQTPGLRAASSGLPPWPPLRPRTPSHPPKSSSAWLPAPAGSAAGPASTTSPASCGSTQGASSCCEHGLAKMLAPTWTGRRTSTRPTRVAGSSSITWASYKETLRYSRAAGHSLPPAPHPFPNFSLPGKPRSPVLLGGPKVTASNLTSASRLFSLASRSLPSTPRALLTRSLLALPLQPFP